MNSEESDFSSDEEFYREKRIKELKQQAKITNELKELNHGEYTELRLEKQVIDATIKSKLVVLHCSGDFERCRILDSHLEKLSKLYFYTKFIKINVMKIPFLVEKLKIKVLPCLLMFKDSIVFDKLVGFEELGNNDDFPTFILEKRLIKSKVINTH